ncbi:MAG: SpoIIE family protein phosphatase [Bacteroidia bacterium]|nr:SpoIIE family protein phosphatase [Bacteroidia bacterium]
MLINYFHRYWRKFVRSGLSKVDTPHDRKSLLFINRMSVINVLLMIGFSITAPLFDLPDVLYFTLPFMAAFGLPPYFNKLGYLNFSRYYFAIIPVVFLAGVCIQNSAELGDKYLLLTSAAIPIILFKEKKSIYILFGLNILTFFFITWYQSAFEPLVQIPAYLKTIYSTFSLLIVFFVIFFIILNFKTSSEEYEEELEEKNRIISQKNSEVHDSITYAKRLQEAIMPPVEEIYNSVDESFILYKPKDIVAGDFYFADKQGDYFFVAAADCTGHGVPGAMVSVVCSNALNRAVNELKLIKPGEILDKVRELVVETFQKSHHDVKDGMDISLCVINQKTYEIAWAGANNPLWYLNENEDELKEVTATKQPVGKSEDYKSFTTHVFNLAKGAMLYLFTDGYADQFGGPKGKKFKYKQLADLIIANRKLPMREQCKILENAFTNWKGNLDQIDDVCIIGLKL